MKVKTKTLHYKNFFLQQRNKKLNGNSQQIIEMIQTQYMIFVVTLKLSILIKYIVKTDFQKILF